MASACIVLLSSFVYSQRDPVEESQEQRIEEARKYATVEISTPKKEFMLGEPIRVDYRFTPKEGVDYNLEPPSIARGSFVVFIATPRGEFKQYRFNGLAFGEKQFANGRSLLFSDDVLLNQRPETAHLSDYGRKQLEKGMLLTDYAFQEPGTYRLKGLLVFNVFLKGADGAVTVRAPLAESEEIVVEIKKPGGEDLKVWEIIQSDRRLGFFMTANYIPRLPITDEQFLNEIEKIVIDHPDSYLAGIIKTKIELYRTRIETRERSTTAKKVAAPQ